MSDWTEYVNDDVRVIAETLAEISRMPEELLAGWSFRMTNAGRLCAYTLSDIYIIHFEHTIDGAQWTVFSKDPGSVTWDSWWEAIDSLVNPQVEVELPIGDV